MKIFNFLTMLMFNLNQENTKKTFKIVTPLQQVLKAIGETNINDNVFYNNTLKYEIINHLNFQELDVLIESIEEVQKKDLISKIIENEKYRWYLKIKEQYYNGIENSKTSLNTTDFIAICIGKKVDLQELKNKSLWQNIYEDLDHKLNMHLIPARTTSYFETSKKLQISVNQALSLFFFTNKKVALIKFKNIVDYDKNNRLHTSYEAEYFEAVRLFFDRLKLDFIPQIDFTNTKSLVEYSNEHNKYATKKDIQKIIDDEDYFNKRAIITDPQKILLSKNISSIPIFKSSLLIFFKNLDKNITLRDIDLFVEILTEINPSFDFYEIKSTQIKLNSLIENKIDRNSLIELLSFLIYEHILIDTVNKLSHLLSKFFNKTKGMSQSNIKDLLYERPGRIKYDYTDSLLRRIKEIIDNG